MNLLNLDEVIAKTKLSKTHIYGFMKKGTFPKQTDNGAKIATWLDEDVNQWIASLKKKGE